MAALRRRRRALWYTPGRWRAPGSARQSPRCPWPTRRSRRRSPVPPRAAAGPTARRRSSSCWPPSARTRRPRPPAGACGRRCGSRHGRRGPTCSRPSRASALLLLPPGTAKAPSRGRRSAACWRSACVLVAAVVRRRSLGSADDDAATAPATPCRPRPRPRRARTPVDRRLDDHDAGRHDDRHRHDDHAERRGADRRRPSSRRPPTTARRRREQAAAERRRAAAAERRRTVTVRVDATGRPTFLCVDDGKGKVLFSGTLDGRQVFKRAPRAHEHRPGLDARDRQRHARSRSTAARRAWTSRAAAARGRCRWARGPARRRRWRVLVP